jgi:hypothetical protein
MPTLDAAARRRHAIGFTRGLIVSSVAAAVWALGATPVDAQSTEDPPGAVSRSSEPFGVAYQDPAEGLVGLGGPPAELGCFGLGFEDNLADFQELQLPSGLVKRVIRDIAADVPLSGFLHR